MKKIFFRLQPVLNVKVIREDLAKQEFAQLQFELEQEQSRLQLLQAEWNETCEWGNDCLVTSLWHQQLYREALKDNIKMQEQKVFQQKELVEQGRERLIDAVKEKKVLENLKEQQAKAHQKMIAQKEGYFLDEIAIAGYSRRFSD
jgi:flagellar FliJ protein